MRLNQLSEAALMTPDFAKSIIKAELDKRNLHYAGLAARWHESSERICVIIYDLEPGLHWFDLCDIARANGFIIEAVADDGTRITNLPPSNF